MRWFNRLQLRAYNSRIWAAFFLLFFVVGALIAAPLALAEAGLDWLLHLKKDL